ncbi:hypothetical protein IQ254_14700 [Nodosilinea sp. LEGE 07088]|uniref:NACHT and WD repeat domain-containing protein n=1 Tax=Nodosilinea sp. LEGE 07088 TaxID=2777968 RepID=UPI001881AB3D|nr:NACHT and WD repeat domain-containing protein [Nodosilinea sp. LEGE 07088]MBE9138422.1 hypothetical protein [Nodosilinea sp. LEGE 07088]
MTDIEEIVRLVDLVYLRKAKASLKTIENEILRGSLLGQGYGEIARAGIYTYDTVRVTGRQLWKKLGGVLGVEVSKSNLGSVLSTRIDSLRQMAAEEEADDESSVGVPDPSDGSAAPRPEDAFHGEAGQAMPAAERLDATDILYGREADLERLKATLQVDRGQIVVLGGRSQAGKSPLVQALTEAIVDDFERVVRFEAFQVPTVAALAEQLQNELQEFVGLSPALALEQLLRQRRWLVVIDSLEHLFQPQGLAGVFRETSTCYEHWLHQLANQSRLQGSLLLVSRAIPQVLHRYRRTVARLDLVTVTVHQLKGWPLALARQWVERQGVSATLETTWQQLLHFCGGHPELLATTTDLILSEHRNDMAAFLRMPERALWQWRLVLQQELTPVERVLLPWLVLRPLSYADLRELWIPRFLPEQLMDGLESLERRHLVDDDRGLYSLHPLALVRCAADLWVEQLFDELCHNRLDWLHWCPLVLTHAPAWQQQQQQQYVLGPLVERLQRQYLSVAEQTALIGRLIACVRASGQGQGPVGQGDYALGNLLNIAAAWNLPFQSFDVSGARLQQVNLSQANIANWPARDCEFVAPVLPVPVSRSLRAAMASTADWLVVGDREGRVIWWSGVAPALAVAGHYQFDGAIAAVAVTAGVMAIATQQQVVVWWPSPAARPNSPSTTPSTSLPVAAPVTCLAFDPAGRYLAAGLETGQVIAWDLYRQESCLDRPSHSYPVNQLVFKADGTQLASYDLGRRILCHRLVDGAEPVAAPLEESFYGSFIGIGWQGNALCAIERMDSTQQVIWRDAQSNQPLAHPAIWDLAGCSMDGLTVAGYDIDQGQVVIQPRGAEAPPILIRALGGQRPDTIQLSHGGDRLLLGNENQVQIWHGVTGRCLWQQQATDTAYSGGGCDLSGSSGIAPWQQMLLETMGVRFTANRTP